MCIGCFWSRSWISSSVVWRRKMVSKFIFGKTQTILEKFQCWRKARKWFRRVTLQFPNPPWKRNVSNLEHTSGRNGVNNLQPKDLIWPNSCVRCFIKTLGDIVMIHDWCKATYCSLCVTSERDNSGFKLDFKLSTESFEKFRESKKNLGKTKNYLTSFEFEKYISKQMSKTVENYITNMLSRK